MSDIPQSPAPAIVVKATAAPIITQEGAKALIIGAVTVGASQFVHSEQALAVVLPVGAVIAGGAITAWQRLGAWGVTKKLANLLPDEIARIEKRK